MTGVPWDDIHAALGEAVELILADHRTDSRLARAEATRYALRLLQYGREALVENHDPAYPQLIKAESPFLQWAFPTPDYTYWYAPVDGRYTYRIYGRRGTARMLAVEIWEGDWSQMHVQKIIDSGAHIIDGRGEIQVEPDGRFELTLSRDVTSSNAFTIADGIGSVVVRECYYDWENEQPAALQIERVGATYPAPPRDADTLERDLVALAEFLRSAPRIMIAGAGLHYQASSSSMPYTNISEAFGNDVGFPEQIYGRGHFHCEPGQAVIVQATPPPCAFWDFQLGSPLWEAGDWLVRPISINGHQAVLDADGVFRAVIAHEDPGVPNWLDPGGQIHGTIGCRWNRYEGTEPPAVPSVRTVRFDGLRNQLPADTPAVSPEERSEMLRRRMHSVRRRNAL